MDTFLTGTQRTTRRVDRCREQAQGLLDYAGIRINGDRPFDMRIHDPRTCARVLAQGSLGLGESYMDGWWDCEQLDEFFHRLLRARLNERVRAWNQYFDILRAKLINLQTPKRAYRVGEHHYDIGNGLYERMLGRHLVYSCGYWAEADNLDDAQIAKIDLICRKLGIESGMRVLDIGCGWGEAARYIARHYGAEVVGVTISREQAEYGRQLCEGLPVDIRLQDYREVEGEFDRILSIGMFEHVGYKNYRTFMETAARYLSQDGLFLLHTIGNNRSTVATDPWIARYIFPNSMIPSANQITEAQEGCFIMEDWHNFGPDYDRTLCAWFANFEAAWPELEPTYGERFHRMWRYYLLSCAEWCRAKVNQLWHIVLTPHVPPGSYRSFR
jgi:cyclopropane-fatty-acyl-phospholipid synthase